MIPDRSLEVLRAIVQDYIASKEPVGSKSLVERHSFGVSAATIRNDMALLEEEELIHAPHTSAGRVPTDSGYRLFVDRLNELKQLSTAEHTNIPDGTLRTAPGAEGGINGAVRIHLDGLDANVVHQPLQRRTVAHNRVHRRYRSD